jgi:hypothetical protein
LVSIPVPNVEHLLQKFSFASSSLMQPSQHVADISDRIVCVKFDGSRCSTRPSSRQSVDKLPNCGLPPNRSYVVHSRPEQKWASPKRTKSSPQNRRRFDGISPESSAFVLSPPMKLLKRLFLEPAHELHYLLACSLVFRG